MRKEFQEKKVSTAKGIESKRKYRKTHRAKVHELSKRNFAIGRKNATKSGQAWTQEEENFIMTSKLTDREIAAKINRSVQAIQVRRSRLRQIQESFDNKESD